jgi:hypothetical protein
MSYTAEDVQGGCPKKQNLISISTAKNIYEHLDNKNPSRSHRIHHGEMNVEMG